MKALYPIIEQVIIDQLLNSKPPVSASMKTAGIFLAICLFLFFAGLIALSYGLFFYLAAQMPDFQAALITGGIFLLLSIALGLSFYVFQMLKRRKKQQKRQEIEELMMVASETIKHDLAETTRNHPETTLLVTALSGFIAGKTLS